MVEVAYDRKRLCVTVKGHAGTAPEGQDLVCAGVSALVNALAVNVMDFGERGMISQAVLRLNKGDAEVSCVPVHGNKKAVKQVFDAFCIGLEALGERFEKNIAYRAVRS